MEGKMPALSIRRDRTPAVLRKLAKGETEVRVARRILAIANALDGMSRDDAARSAGMDRQTLRDWVIRYNEHSLDGRPPKLEADEKAELLQIVLAGSDPETSGLSAFTRDDLVRICEERFGKRLHATSVFRHPQKDLAAQAAFKKSPGAARTHSAYAQK